IRLVRADGSRTLREAHLAARLPFSRITPTESARVWDAVATMATRTSLGLIRQERAFRALWTARSVSFVGSSLSQVALILYVADRMGTGAAVALLMIVGTLLPTLASPLAGAVVDRLPPRPLLLGCELGQAAVLALIAVLLPGLPLLLALIA